MPVTPQITLQGSLQDIMGDVDNGSSLVVQLVNFGNYVPRVAGTAIIAKTSPLPIACPAGTYDFNLYGNDVITPAGTYYTIQILDDNGNVVQTNAYQFAGSGTIDLSTLAPYLPGPYVPPVPPSPSPSALYVVVPWAATPDFDALGTEGIVTFDMVLTGDVIMPTISNVTPGQIITFILQQDGAGGHTFGWPMNVFGGGVIDADVSAISRQTFVVRGDGNLYHIGPMCND